MSIFTFHQPSLDTLQINDYSSDGVSSKPPKNSTKTKKKSHKGGKFRLRPPTDRQHDQWCGWIVGPEWAMNYGRSQDMDIENIDTTHLALAAIDHLQEYSGYPHLTLELACEPVGYPQMGIMTCVAICGSKLGQRQRPTQEQLDKLIYIMQFPPEWYTQCRAYY